MEWFNNYLIWSRNTFGYLMPLVIAPIWQELVFRYIPFKFLPFTQNHFWTVGIATSLLYGLIHWYFGWIAVVLTFIWGLILWYIVSKYGLIPVILLHSGMNLIVIALGISHLGAK